MKKLTVGNIQTLSNGKVPMRILPEKLSVKKSASHVVRDSFFDDLDDDSDIDEPASDELKELLGFDPDEFNKTG